MTTVEALVLIAYAKILYFALYNQKEIEGIITGWDDFLEKIFYDQFDDSVRKIAVNRAIESDDLELYYAQECPNCHDLNYLREDSRLSTYRKMAENQGHACISCGHKMPFLRQNQLDKHLCISQKNLLKTTNNQKEEEYRRKAQEERIYQKILRQIARRPLNE